MHLNLPYSLLQDVTNVAPAICDQCAKQYSKQVNVGESIHLPCNVPAHLVAGQATAAAQQPVSWHFTSANGETAMELRLAGNTLASLHLRQRFVQTSDGGLVVLGATTKEHGYFECRLSNKPLFRYQITVDTSKFIRSTSPTSPICLHKSKLKRSICRNVRYIERKRL